MKANLLVINDTENVVATSLKAAPQQHNHQHPTNALKDKITWRMLQKTMVNGIT